MKLESVIVTKVSTNRDGGLRLVLDTQELSSEDKAALFDLHTGACNVTLDNPTFLEPVKPEDQF